MKKRFVCGYMGCAWYKIADVEYRQRHFTSEYERSICNTGVFDSEVAPCVGTVMGETGIFPTDDVMQEFPGYVPARWNPDTNRIETKGKPDVIPGYNNNVLAAKRWAEETEKLYKAA